MRHGLALLFAAIGTISAVATFFYHYYVSTNALPQDSSWPDGIFWAEEYPGGSLWQAGRRFIIAALPYCSSAYLLVLAFLSIRYVNQYTRSKQLSSQGLSKIQPGFRVFAAETSRLMGIRREVLVWLSSMIEGPVTLGFLKPVILLPVAMVNNLSTEQVEAILIHELAHVKRNDYLLHLAMTLLEMLFFFNPFTRWLIRDIRREREHRCDDLVMQFRYDPHAYISALLSLASTTAAQRQQLALAATGSDDQLLLKRARRILQIKETKDRPGTRALVFLLPLLVGFFALLIRTPHSGNQIHEAGNRQLATTPNRPGQGHPPAPVPFAEQSLPASHSFPDATPHPLAVPAPAGKSDLAPQPIISAALPTTTATPLHKKSSSAAVVEPDEDMDTEEAVMAAAQDNANPDNADPGGEFATIIQPAGDREYSMEPAAAGAPPTMPVKIAISSGQPFVPNSSFSFQTVRDTAKLVAQYAYLQSLASHELIEAVKKMEKQLQAQLRLLQLRNCSKEQQAALQKEKRILEEQLQLQQQFLRKQQALERKLERAGKVRRIVVI